jgi:hypothetical protein
MPQTRRGSSIPQRDRSRLRNTPLFRKPNMLANRVNSRENSRLLMVDRYVSLTRCRCSRFTARLPYIRVVAPCWSSRVSTPKIANAAGFLTGGSGHSASCWTRYVLVLPFEEVHRRQFWLPLAGRGVPRSIKQASRKRFVQGIFRECKE